MTPEELQVKLQEELDLLVDKVSNLDAFMNRPEMEILNDISTSTNNVMDSYSALKQQRAAMGMYITSLQGRISMLKSYVVPIPELQPIEPEPELEGGDM